MRVSRMTVVVLVTVGMVCGCAVTGDRISSEEAAKESIPDPSEEVAAALAEYHAAMKAQDVGKIMAAVSEDFSSSTTNKSGLRTFFEGAIAQGLFTDMAVNTEECGNAVTGDSATATPVTYGPPGNSSSYAYTMRREADGVWRIVNSEPVY